MMVAILLQWIHDKNKMVKDNKEQFEILLNGNYLIAPSSFINYKTLLDLGGFNEKFILIEDLPLWIKISKAGIKFHYFPDFTVIYRVHSTSIWGGNNFNNQYLTDYKLIHFYLIFPELLKKFRFLSFLSSFVSMSIFLLQAKKKDNSGVIKLLKLLSPLHIMSAIKRRKRLLLNKLRKHFPEHDS